MQLKKKEIFFLNIYNILFDLNDLLILEFLFALIIIITY